MRQLMVGAGKACIDPERDMFPLPNPRPGRDGKPFVQEEIYDSCYCRAIVISSDGIRALLLSYELVSAPASEELEQALQDQTGIPKEQIYIMATHNHTAPFDRGDRPLNEFPPESRAWYARYEQIEKEAGLAAATQALSSLRPCRMSFCQGVSYINVNRDVRTPSGCWVEGCNPAGFSDKTLSVLKFEDLQGKLIAALLNHPTHATCGMKMRDSDGKGKTSGNFPGIACRFVEEHYRADSAVVMWTSGAAGDQGPLFHFGLQMEYPDGYSTLAEYPDGTGMLQMEYLGRLHGADAVALLAQKCDGACEAPLHFAQSTVMLPAQKQIAGPKGPVRMGGFGPRLQTDVKIGPPGELPVMAPDPECPAELTLRAMELGGVTLLFLNAEVYAKLGVRIKECRAERPVILITHVAKGAGDILDADSADHRVLQAFGRIIPGAADEILLRQVERLMRELE